MQRILENQKTYVNIVDRKSIIFPKIEEALKIVEKFIVENGYILYGGMAIDLSLKAARHEGIYSKDVLPDYDFMTPTFFDDSNKLAQILHKEDMPNVSAINAMHLTSRRVRVNFVPVADLTYIPNSIYEKLPFIEVNPVYSNSKGKLKVIHPMFQRMDMHHAFNFPYDNPPREVILHRTKKDNKRYKLLDSAYPIEPKKEYMEKYSKLTNEVTLIVYKDYLQDTVIGGFITYAINLKILRSLWKKTDISKIVNEEYYANKYTELFDIDCELTEKSIELHFNKELKGIMNVNIFTEHFENLLHKIPHNTIQYYNKYLDNLRPRTVLLMSDSEMVYELFDVKGKIITCYNLQKLVNDFSIGKSKNNTNIYLCQMHNVMLYFLQKYFERKDEIYLYLYYSSITLVEIAEQLFRIKEDKKSIEDYPMFLTTYTHGKYNWSPDYINSIMEKIYIIQGIPPKEREILRAPFGYYPEKTDTWPEFHPTTSEFYLIDGDLRDTPFKPITLIPQNVNFITEGAGVEKYVNSLAKIITPENMCKNSDNCKKIAELFNIYRKLFLAGSKLQNTIPKINLNMIKERIPYSINLSLIKPSLHIGQRKLFLSELQFLTEFTGDYIVYAGAAPSNHTGYLAELFPNLKFLLIDPNKFDIHNYNPQYLVKNRKWETSLSETIQEFVHNSNRICIIQDYFTLELAQEINKLNKKGTVLFISDIRTNIRDSKAAVEDESGAPTDLDIVWNMSQQFNWVILIKPSAFMLKFRYPFYTEINHFQNNYQNSPFAEEFKLSLQFGVDFVNDYFNKQLKYLKGDINLQVWAPTSSTETRLVGKSLELTDYGSYSDYEDKLFYYNNIERPFVHHINPLVNQFPQETKKRGIDNCGDCALEYHIWNEYNNKIKKVNILNCFDNLTKNTSNRSLLTNKHGKLYEPLTVQQLNFMISTH